MRRLNVTLIIISGLVFWYLISLVDYSKLLLEEHSNGVFGIATYHLIMYTWIIYLICAVGVILQIIAIFLKVNDDLKSKILTSGVVTFFLPAAYAVIGLFMLYTTSMEFKRTTEVEQADVSYSVDLESSVIEAGKSYIKSDPKLLERYRVNDFLLSIDSSAEGSLKITFLSNEKPGNIDEGLHLIISKDGEILNAFPEN